MWMFGSPLSETPRCDEFSKHVAGPSVLAVVKAQLLQLKNSTSGHIVTGISGVRRLSLSHTLQWLYLAVSLLRRFTAVLRL
jgi:hypothetical protein